MIQNIFDSHSHYKDDRFNNDRDELLSSMNKNGVRAIINAGSEFEILEDEIKMAEKYPFMFSAVGIHPQMANDIPKGYLEKLEEYTKSPKVIAIGEIGLDYHYDDYVKENQIKLLREQLQLATKLDLPVILHFRDATEDMFEVLKDFKVRGVVHCFSGSAETATELIKMDFHIGFTGVVTFKNANKTIKAVEAVPMDRLLVETDCPYMAPVPFRGKRCDSTMLPFIIEKIAEIKGISPQEVADITFNNTCRLFNIEI